MGVENIEFSAFVREVSSDSEEFRRIFLRTFGRDPEAGELVVAKSVGVLHLPHASEQLYRHNKDARIILSLRDPVERAYSSYWHQRKRGGEDAETFEEALRLERQREERDAWEPDRMYLGKGRYLEHLRRLVGIFGRDQIHVLILDELQRQPSETVNEVFEFLELGRCSIEVEIATNQAKMPRFPWLAQIVEQESVAKDVFRSVVPESVRRRLFWWIRRTNTVDREPPPMNEDTRARLEEYFRPYNQRLAEFLGRDLSAWSS